MSGPDLAAAPDLAAVPLLAGLPQADLAQVASFMTRLEVSPGTRVFVEGEPGDRLCVVESGRLEATIRMPDGGERTLGHLEAGATAGEIALLTGGRRTATVTALTPTRGWIIDGRAFQALRLDPRRGAIALMRRLGMLALSRLRVRYEHVAAEIGGRPSPEPVAPGEPVRQGALGLDYLCSLLCFVGFEQPPYVAEVLRGVPTRCVARGDLVLREGARPESLILVARGAIEVTVRHTTASRRMRLAGPGRLLGYSGMLDDGMSPVAARARERTLMYEFPRDRVLELLEDPAPAARRMAAAVYEDIARAVRQAERPMAATTVASGRALKSRQTGATGRGSPSTGARRAPRSRSPSPPPSP